MNWRSNLSKPSHARKRKKRHHHYAGLASLTALIASSEGNQTKVTTERLRVTTWNRQRRRTVTFQFWKKEKKKEKKKKPRREMNWRSSLSKPLHARKTKKRHHHYAGLASLTALIASSEDNLTKVHTERVRVTTWNRQRRRTVTFQVIVPGCASVVVNIP